MGLHEILEKLKQSKVKYKEAKEDMNIHEKLANSKKSVNEIYLEKHYEKLRQQRMEALAHKIQRQEGAKMMSTAIPKYKNTFRTDLKLCSSEVKL